MFFSAEICPRRGIDGNAFWLPKSYAAAIAVLMYPPALLG